MSQFQVITHSPLRFFTAEDAESTEKSCRPHTSARFMCLVQRCTYYWNE